MMPNARMTMETAFSMRFRSTGRQDVTTPPGWGGDSGVSLLRSLRMINAFRP